MPKSLNNPEVDSITVGDGKSVRTGPLGDADEWVAVAVNGGPFSKDTTSTTWTAVTGTGDHAIIAPDDFLPTNVETFGISMSGEMYSDAGDEVHVRVNEASRGSLVDTEMTSNMQYYRAMSGPIHVLDDLSSLIRISLEMKVDEGSLGRIKGFNTVVWGRRQ